MLLDRRPLFWTANDHYVILVSALTVAASLWPRLAALRWNWQLPQPGTP